MAVQRRPSIQDTSGCAGVQEVEKDGIYACAMTTDWSQQPSSGFAAPGSGGVVEPTYRIDGKQLFLEQKIIVGVDIRAVKGAERDIG